MVPDAATMLPAASIPESATAPKPVVSQTVFEAGISLSSVRTGREGMMHGERAGMPVVSLGTLSGTDSGAHEIARGHTVGSVPREWRAPPVISCVSSSSIARRSTVAHVR